MDMRMNILVDISMLHGKMPGVRPWIYERSEDLSRITISEVMRSYDDELSSREVSEIYGKLMIRAKKNALRRSQSNYNIHEWEFCKQFFQLYQRRWSQMAQSC